MQIDGVGKQRILLVDKLTEELIVVLVPIAPPMDHKSVGLDTSLARFESGWMVAEDDVAADHVRKLVCPQNRIVRPSRWVTRQTFSFETITSMGFSLRPTSAIRSPRSGRANSSNSGRVGDSSSTP